MYQLATALFTVLIAIASAQSLENSTNHESSNATVQSVSLTLDNQNKSSSIDESSLTTVIDKSFNDTEIKSTEATTEVTTITTTTPTTTTQDLLIPPATVKPQIVFANVTTKKPSRLQAAA